MKRRCTQATHTKSWTGTPVKPGRTVNSYPGMPEFPANFGGGTATVGGIINSTTQAHGHDDPVPNVDIFSATITGSGSRAALASGKRRLEEKEEADGDKHRTQRRKVTHVFD